jgi:hypothetical protein
MISSGFVKRKIRDFIAVLSLFPLNYDIARKEA